MRNHDIHPPAMGPGGQGGGALQAFFLHGATHTEFGEKTASRRLEVYARFYF